jgi:hypothetical protein
MSDKFLKFMKTLAIPISLLFDGNLSYGSIAQSHLSTSSDPLQNAVRFDFRRAIVQSSEVTNQGSTKHTGEVLKLGDLGRFVGIVPKFKLGLNDSSSSALAARSFFQIIVPFELPQGQFPSSIKVRSAVFIEKDSDVNFALSSYIRFGGFSTGVQSQTFPSGSPLSEVIPLEAELDILHTNPELKTSFCNQGYKGNLSVSFALSAERENAGTLISVVPAAGPSLVVFVESEGQSGCSTFGSPKVLK